MSKDNSIGKEINKRLKSKMSCANCKREIKHNMGIDLCRKCLKR